MSHLLTKSPITFKTTTASHQEIEGKQEDVHWVAEGMLIFLCLGCQQGHLSADFLAHWMKFAAVVHRQERIDKHEFFLLMISRVSEAYKMMVQIM